MVNIKQIIKDFVARLIYLGIPHNLLIDKRYFDLWERKGWHILPVHFYQPIPDLRQLPETWWDKISELPGIDVNEAAHLALLEEFDRRFKAEYEAFPKEPTGNPLQYFGDQTWFSRIDAAILHCMIRKFRPRRIVEVGSGMTTLISAAAICRNQQDGAPPCELVAIEPYPSEQLRRGIPGLARLIERPVERVPMEEFMALGDGDILFIDSTHVIKTAGDVVHEILEILPRLKPGVLVHFHDIFLPEDYPREWFRELRIFWTEQYLLQAFLAFNSAFEVLWPGRLMQRCHPELMTAAFNFLREDTTSLAGSFWIRKTR